MADPVKALRHEAIRRLIEHDAIDRQEALVEKLDEAGFKVTQSSVSRDLHEIGVVKLGGRYVFSDASKGSLPGILGAVQAGPNLLVLKTDVGAAQLVAVRIDGLGLAVIAGTIAGDDTIFVATKDRAAQDEVVAALGVVTL
ncbi:MAG: arginine repressor [Armatimonadetes bacterium]|nr:arginine repressor [Armatimonadota bacterium]